MVKKPDAFSVTKKSEILEKVLRVVNKSYKNSYTNGLNIQGKWMKQFGFEVGDKVKVEVSKHRILVEKVVEE